MHAGSGTAGDEAARAALALPRGRHEDIGVPWIHLDVVRAGPVVDVKDAAPGGAAVCRFVHAAFAALAPQRALRGDVDDVRVSGIDQDAADMFAFLEADIFPRPSTIDRLVYTIAVGDHALGVVFARADPDHVRVLRVDRDRARRERAFAVEDRRERQSGVDRLPDPAGGRGDVPDLLVGRVDGDVGDAAGGKGWPYGPEAQASDQGSEFGGVGCGCGGRRR